MLLPTEFEPHLEPVLDAKRADEMSCYAALDALAEFVRRNRPT